MSQICDVSKGPRQSQLSDCVPKAGHNLSVSISTNALTSQC